MLDQRGLADARLSPNDQDTAQPLAGMFDQGLDSRLLLGSP